MKKWFSVFLVAIMALGLNAQEFGSEAGAEEAAPVGSGEAVQEMQQAMEEEVPVSDAKQTPAQELTEFANKKGYNIGGYDKDKKAIYTIAQRSIRIKNPKRSSSDFIDRRQQLMTEVLMVAKAQIIESIISNMSAERQLYMPGNPIAKQLEALTKEVDDVVAEASDQFDALLREVAEAEDEKDSGSISGVIKEASALYKQWDEGTLKTSDVLDSLSKLVGGFEERYTDISEYNSDRIEQYENLKKQLDEAKSKLENAKAEAEKAKGTLQQSLSSKIDLLAQMQIFGCTVIQQADNFRNENGKYFYDTAILYSWSEEMQNAASKILKGESVKFSPGKKTVGQWLNGKSQRKKGKPSALSAWVGPRNYIDDKGNMWFLGIACAPVDTDDAVQDGANVEMAQMQAMAEVAYSLFADASSKRTAEILKQTTKGANGQQDEKTLKDFSKLQSEKFENIQIAGCAEKWSGIVTDSISGVDMHVSVYGVSSGDATALKSIKDRATALAIEMNSAQERERAHQEQLQKEYESSKRNDAARAEGVRQAKESVKRERAKIAAEREAAKEVQSNTVKSQKSQSNSGYSTSGTYKIGLNMVLDDDDDE